MSADVENAESGFVEPSERLDSGLPTSMESEPTTIHVQHVPWLLVLLHFSLFLSLSHAHPHFISLSFSCSFIPAESIPKEHPSEIESQRAMQALKDRQQMAFEVCDRMFNALLAWATTKDVRYLLAAQRSLTAVQNQEGDT